MKDKHLFLQFGLLQAIALGFIIFFLLGNSGIGLDTQIVLSVIFPVFLLTVEYMIYAKK